MGSRARNWKQWEDLSSEEEEKLIGELAIYFVNRNLGTLAKIILESGGTLTSLFAEFYMGLYGPYFDFLGIDRYVALLRKKKNSAKLIEKIDIIKEELEGKKQANKMQLSSSSEKVVKS